LLAVFMYVRTFSKDLALAKRSKVSKTALLSLFCVLCGVLGATKKPALPRRLQAWIFLRSPAAPLQAVAGRYVPGTGTETLRALSESYVRRTVVSKVDRTQTVSASAVRRSYCSTELSGILRRLVLWLREFLRTSPGIDVLPPLMTFGAPFS
jgi:hypothetical protein